MLEIPLLILVGCILGIITGLTPGIHINLVAAIILSLSQVILRYISESNLIVVIIAMAVMHIFLDIIPSVFFGAPSPDSAITILPSHKLLLEGKAHEAITLTLIGAIGAIVFILFLTPALIYLMPKIYLTTKPYIHVLLIIAALFLILKEENKLITFVIFILAGTLGVVALNIPNLSEPLLPLLSGLFGLSSLILSIKNNTLIPEQKIIAAKISFSKLKYIIIGSFAGIISAFLPGLGSSQTSVISTSFMKKIESRDYLTLNSSVNAVNMIGSFITLYTINKSRNGVAIAISKIISNFNFYHFLLVISIILITCFIATLLTLIFSRIFSRVISRLNYKKLCLSIIILNFILVLVISNYIGLIILVTSTFLGIFAQLSQVNKNHLMACILLPVILFFVV